MASTLRPAELFALDALVTPTAQGIASRGLRARRQATSPCLPSMPVKSCRSTPRHSMRSSSHYRGLLSYDRRA